MNVEGEVKEFTKDVYLSDCIRADSSSLETRQYGL